MMQGGMSRAGRVLLTRRLFALAVMGGMLRSAARVSAQEDTIEVLVEVPSTGASRLGPITQAVSHIPAPPRVSVAPIELQADKIGLDAPIEMGQVVDGVMIDPSGPWVVVWYENLGKVGDGGNVVMAGHVDYWSVGPAIFWNIRDLLPGDSLRLVGENGESFEYAVEWTYLYDVATELTPEVIQNEIVADTGQESLTLITCGGEFVPDTAEYLQRYVVRANLIS
jgi:sortase family protein